MNYDTLYKNIDYTFNDVDILQKGLTHRSVSNQNNERMEFLGDSIVNFIIAEALFEKFTKVSEGHLSRMRASLVNKETLALVAGELNLGEFIKLGSGELSSGGYRRASILADGLEALIAAIYLDANLATCKAKILLWFTQLLTDISTDVSHKDSKTELQEYLQARKLDLPRYDIVKTEGKDHNQIFHVSCTLHQPAKKATGKGSSRRRAEQTAANLILQELPHD